MHWQVARGVTGTRGHETNKNIIPSVEIHWDWMGKRVSYLYRSLLGVEEKGAYDVSQEGAFKEE